MKHRITTCTILVAAIALMSVPAAARIKLVALPERQTAIVRLDNPVATLVEEERTLTLQKGLNKVDFSWKAVQIDPDSIRLRILGHPDAVVLLSVSYPPNEDALVWQISAAQAFNEPVRISYLLSNIDRLVTYKAVADKPETVLDLASFVVLRNFSGEDFVNAMLRLDYGESFEKSIQHGETKRMLFFSKDGVPFEKTWTWDSQQQPWDPEKMSENVGIPVYYAVANDAESGLGQNALWGGKARVFQQDGHGSTIFLGEDTPPLVPVGEKMKLYIGDSRDIVVTQKQLKDNRIVTKRNSSGHPVLSDTDELMEVTVENFKDKPAVLILTEHFQPQWDMAECTHEYERKDAGTIEFRIELGPKEKEKITMHYHRRNLR